jgi:hypothetical protein
MNMKEASAMTEASGLTKDGYPSEAAGGGRSKHLLRAVDVAVHAGALLGRSKSEQTLQPFRGSI